MSNKYWKYLKKGDIVRNESVWGNKLFEVNSLHGNWYCPLITVYMLGKPKKNENMCNFNANDTKLITTNNRPFKRLFKKNLLKLVSRGNIEARRELMIRVNTKSF